MAQQKVGTLVALILKCIAVATAIAAVVLLIVNPGVSAGILLLLGIGLFALAVASLQS